MLEDLEGRPKVSYPGLKLQYHPYHPHPSCRKQQNKAQLESGNPYTERLYKADEMKESGPSSLGR